MPNGFSTHAQFPQQEVATTEPIRRDGDYMKIAKKRVTEKQLAWGAHKKWLRREGKKLGVKICSS